MASYDTACFCGSVKLRVSGEPAAMGYCHCSSCRHWSAGPVNAFTLWKPENVKVRTTFLGGGFGRRANKHNDFVAEAAEVAKVLKKPVKVIWTREDDTTHAHPSPDHQMPRAKDERHRARALGHHAADHAARRNGRRDDAAGAKQLVQGDRDGECMLGRGGIDPAEPVAHR